ncbi:CHASE domain-containing protein [Pseudoduganella chitinolytica]|uniref:histidine kinase n=1 Tax=Pseudoduganella chitinolytica TaxID=34070 RepID=A0ABY8BGA0_9BURK|nr:CHASE domain-containing protein [Pseudoduganella chitinolytica]WEF34950.1 CHASE domain-containing protein [Pseudoduganella chitinolytica]
MRTRSPSALTGRIGANVLCTAAFLAAAALCVVLSIPRGNGSPIWLPTGVALAALLQWGRWLWPGVALGSLLFNLYLMDSGHGLSAATAGAAALITAGNVLALLLAQRGIRALDRTVKRDSAAVVHGYLGIAAACSALAAATGAVALAAAGVVPVAERGPVAFVWWLGDMTAMLAVTPLLSAWADATARQRLRVHAAETVLVLLASGALVAAVFQLEWLGDAQRYGPPFLLLVPVAWAALRLGAAASTAVVVIAAAGAVLATLWGDGQFATRSQLHSLVALDLYIAILAVTGMVLTNTSAGHTDPAGLPVRSRWPVLMLALCLTVTIGAWHAAARYGERRINEQFAAQADAAWRQIDYRLANYRRLLRAGKAFFDASENVTANEWHSFASSFDIEHAFPGTQGLGFAQWVPAADLPAFEAARQGHWPGFRVWPRITAGHGAVVTYLEPHNVRNDRAMGFDMYAEPVRRAAMQAAARLGRIGSTAVVTLVQEVESDRQVGFLMYEPVYRRGAPHATPAERLAALSGFVYSPFRLGDMIGSMVGREAPFTLRIWDGPLTRGRLIFSNDTAPARGSRYARPLSLAQAISVDETGRYWTVELTATDAFEATIDRHSSLIILGLGTLISLLMFEVVKSLATTRSRALRLAQDMTHEVHEQQRAVQRSEARLRLFTASVRSHAIIFLDSAGNVEAWNEGAANLFGYSDEEAVGRPLPVWDAAGAGTDALVQAMATGTCAGLRTFVCKDGKTFVGEMQLSAVRADGAGPLTGFAFIVRDVTEAQAAEEQMRRAKEHAESASRAKSSFVANMSHELRTPMNAVLGLAAVLGRTRLDNEQKNFVNMIRTSGQTLLAVLNDILDFSKIEAGRIELAPVPMAPDALAQVAAALMAVSGGGRLRLVVDVDPGLPLEVVADPLRLEQILTNLIGNALKFTERGAVHCRLRAGTGEAGQLLLVVEVSDTGIGMDPDQLQRLFSPFVQADASMSRRFGGTGLGLTIARGLAERMAGRIDVTSAPGSGSTFALTVPVQPVPDATDRYALPAGWQGIDVLLFESDPDVAAALAHATVRWGWRLYPVNDFDQARETLGGTGPLPHRLALIGPGSQGVTPLALLAPRRERLPAGFALVQISAGFAPPLAGAAQAFPFALVHAPATRATLHAALGQLALAPASGAADAPAPSPSDLPLAGMHVLLAEDHPVNQTVAVTMLRYAGAEVTVADNGRAAVDALRQNPARYAVVLMDVQMPELDGLQAARIVRDTLRLTVPIVAMSAGVTEAERTACRAAGMDDFIAKPVEEEDMVATLLRWRPASFYL